jgi:hypothetical protein
MMPPFSVLMEQIGAPIAFGPMQVCLGSYKGRFCIGREDKDQWRFWTGVNTMLFVPKSSSIAIWECSGRETAEMWLTRLKNGTADAFSLNDNEKLAMPELPANPEQRSGETKADQGQESV